MHVRGLGFKFPYHVGVDMAVHMSTPRAANWLILTALLSCSGVSILSTDLFTPSLPHLPELLSSTPQVVQLTMSLNLAAYAICQLFYGPVADRVGRRPLLLFGLIGFLISSIVCAVAPTVEILIAGRIAQGVFASAETIVTMLLIRELFEGDEGTRAMGLFGMGLGAFPAIGPLLGGYIHVWAGWRANFVLMAVAIVVCGLLAFKVLPETKVPDRAALNLRHIGRTYLSLLRDRAILQYLIPLGTGMAGLFAFITAGPFIFIDLMGVPTQRYGLYTAATVVSYIAGSYSVSHFAHRVRGDVLVGAGVRTLLAGGIAFLAVIGVGWVTPLSLVAAVSICAFGIGLVYGAAPMLLLDAAGDTRRGMASGLMGFVELGCAALGALAVGVLYDGSAMPCAIVMAISGLVGAVFWWGIRRSGTNSVES